MGQTYSRGSRASRSSGKTEEPGSGGDTQAGAHRLIVLEQAQLQQPGEGEVKTRYSEPHVMTTSALIRRSRVDVCTQRVARAHLLQVSHARGSANAAR